VEGLLVINNRKDVKCERCGRDGYITVHADGFDDAPEKFTAKQECKGGCEPRYFPMTAQEMHERFGYPRAGWSETKY
jgi:hypothetical protein